MAMVDGMDVDEEGSNDSCDEGEGEVDDAGVERDIEEGRRRRDEIKARLAEVQQR